MCGHDGFQQCLLRPGQYLQIQPFNLKSVKSTPGGAYHPPAAYL
ncbi:MAG: hypothetical protein ACJATG_001666, partial [Dinoroseobacter sp.]